MAWGGLTGLGKENYGFGKLKNLLQPRKPPSYSYIPPGKFGALSMGKIATAQRRAGSAMGAYQQPKRRP